MILPRDQSLSDIPGTLTRESKPVKARKPIARGKGITKREKAVKAGKTRFADSPIPTTGKSKREPVNIEKGVTIKTIDGWFSLYIRLKYSRPYSDTVDVRVGDCFTCGKTQLITVLENGHYIGRQHYATRWEEKNCRPQCTKCNHYNEGEHGKFREGLVEIYGEEEITRLESLRRGAKKPTKSESVELSKKFREAYKALKGKS